MKPGRADVAAVGASIIWGVNYSSVKLALTYLTPFTMGMLRFFIAGVATFLLLKNIEKGVVISRVHAIRVVVLGVVGFGIQQILFLSGFHYLNASLAALLSAFTTAIMIVITSLIIRERMTVLTLAGVGIA